ncbi:MAG TPA: serine hydrolase domain-containing protein [Pyrinomonadaceae bacterium]
MPRMFLSVALALALETAAFAQATPTPRDPAPAAESPAARVDRVFAQWDRPDTPGCALAVVRDGRVVYERGYGTANLGLSVPITPATVFNAGSIAKQFTAMSVVMLARQGKLSLNDDDHGAVIRGLAEGYLPNGDAGFLKGVPSDDFYGSGGLFTTVEDLARWDQNFYDGKVGGPAAVEQMLTPGVLNDGTKLDYAFGLNVGPPYKGLKTVFHNGSRAGYRGILQRFPEQHFSVALLCNVRIASDPLAARVADIYLAGELKPAAANQGSPPAPLPGAVKVTERELASVAGLYFNPTTDAVRRVYVKDGKLMYARAPGNESELSPLGGGRFVMLGVRNRVEVVFRPPRAGAAPRLFFSQEGAKPSVQEPVRAASYTPRQLIEFAGEYRSTEVGATYNVTPQGGGLLLRTGNWGDFLLSPRFRDSFENQAQMGSISFTRDGRNRVSGFVIRSGKVKNLRFDKVG